MTETVTYDFAAQVQKDLDRYRVEPRCRVFVPNKVWAHIHGWIDFGEAAHYWYGPFASVEEMERECANHNVGLDLREVTQVSWCDMVLSKENIYGLRPREPHYDRYNSETGVFIPG